MAEKKVNGETFDATGVVTEAAPETVAKADYDTLVKEYQRVATAFNKAIGIIANDYAEKVAKQIFEEIDKAAI